MCNLIKIDLGSNWKEELLNIQRKSRNINPNQKQNILFQLPN